MESTLSLRFEDLSGEVGLFLGYGRGEQFDDPPWDTRQAAAVDSCVRSGLRQFYYPPMSEGNPSGYSWSFLQPTVELTLPSGDKAIQLPDDFGGMEGDIALLSSGSQCCVLRIGGSGIIDQHYATNPDTTGVPTMAALRPIKGTTKTKGQRSQLYLWPLADREYTLRFTYYVNGDYLNSAFPYHLGGMAHAETVLESCLAIAEQRLDDSAMVHTMKFKERLAASIILDRRNKAQHLGYNRDLSDMRDRHWSGRDRPWGNPVRVNGVAY